MAAYVVKNPSEDRAADNNIDDSKDSIVRGILGGSSICDAGGTDIDESTRNRGDGAGDESRLEALQTAHPKDLGVRAFSRFYATNKAIAHIFHLKWDWDWINANYMSLSNVLDVYGSSQLYSSDKLQEYSNLLRLWKIMALFTTDSAIDIYKPIDPYMLTDMANTTPDMIAGQTSQKMSFQRGILEISANEMISRKKGMLNYFVDFMGCISIDLNEFKKCIYPDMSIEDIVIQVTISKKQYGRRINSQNSLTYTYEYVKYSREEYLTHHTYKIRPRIAAINGAIRVIIDMPVQINLAHCHSIRVALPMPIDIDAVVYTFSRIPHYKTERANDGSFYCHIVYSVSENCLNNYSHIAYYIYYDNWQSVPVLWKRVLCCKSLPGLLFDASTYNIESDRTRLVGSTPDSKYFCPSRVEQFQKYMGIDHIPEDILEMEYPECCSVVYDKKEEKEEKGENADTCVGTHVPQPEQVIPQSRDWKSPIAIMCVATGVLAMMISTIRCSR